MYELDLSAQPIVVVRMSGETQDADLERFLGQVDAAMESTVGAFTLVSVVGSVSRTSPSQNATLRSWYAQQEGALRERCVGVAFVIPRRSWRVIARAALSRRPPPLRHLLCAGEAEAKAWCADRLASL